jgi:hypothetical protein
MRAGAGVVVTMMRLLRWREQSFSNIVIGLKLIARAEESNGRLSMVSRDAEIADLRGDIHNSM